MKIPDYDQIQEFEYLGSKKIYKRIFIKNRKEVFIEIYYNSGELLHESFCTKQLNGPTDIWYRKSGKVDTKVYFSFNKRFYPWWNLPWWNE